MLDFVKGFFCQLRLLCNTLACIYFFVWCFMLIDFHMLNHPCTPGINHTWPWLMIFSIICYILFANLLLRIFVTMFSKEVDLSFPFSIGLFSGFGIRMMLACRDNFGSNASLSNLWKSLRVLHYWHYIVLKNLIKFSSEFTRIWVFLSW